MARGLPRGRLSEQVARDVLDRLEADGWGGLCECGCGERASEWHHIFTQKRWPELIDVAANIVAVAKRCHERHTKAAQRFPRSLCRRAEGLVSSPAMESYLDRFYGSGE